MFTLPTYVPLTPPCVCVCVSVCVCMCVHTHEHTNMCVCVCVCYWHQCVVCFIYVGAQVNGYMFVCVYVHIETPC